MGKQFRESIERVAIHVITLGFVALGRRIGRKRRGYMDKYVVKCDCGRIITVFLKDGKLAHKITGTGDALLDAFGASDEKPAVEEAGGNDAKK